MSARVPMVGKVFGGWLVLREATSVPDSRGKLKRRVWVRCTSCGYESRRIAASIRQARRGAVGCQACAASNREATRKRKLAVLELALIAVRGGDDELALTFLRQLVR